MTLALSNYFVIFGQCGNLVDNAYLTAESGKNQAHV